MSSDEPKLIRRDRVKVNYACSARGCNRIKKPFSKEEGWIIAEVTRDHKRPDYFNKGDIVIRCPDHATSTIKQMVGQAPVPKWSPVRTFKRWLRRRHKRSST